MIFGIASVFSWIANPKNRSAILVILIAILVALFFFQRSRTQSFKFKYEEQKKETTRVTNNYKASEDSLIILVNGNTLTGEISGYKLTIDELKGEYSNLFDLYRIEKNKPPKVIIETKYKLVESITEIPTHVNDSLVTFFDSVNYGDGNWRVVEAKIPYSFIYRIKTDSVNDHEFLKALRYAFSLRDNGIKDAFVVIYENNKRINYNDAKNLDSLIYRVQIFASNIDFSEKEIEQKFNLDYVYKSYENNMFKYMTGIFIPKQNIQPIVPYDELNNFTQLKTGLADANIKFGMNFATALIKDPETDEIKIQVVTKYPGIIIQDINGVEIMETIKENKKIARQFKQEWGIGFHFGYGAMLVPIENSGLMFKTGPNFSIGVNYTPRFLQFGPRQTGKNTLDNLLN